MISVPTKGGTTLSEDGRARDKREAYLDSRVPNAFPFFSIPVVTPRLAWGIEISAYQDGSCFATLTALLKIALNLYPILLRLL